MRVITGSAKGRKLQSVPGDTTRPITDRAKEALFSIIGDWIEGARILDLFGGTGAVGIEALSRGADHALFVDRARPAVATMRANLKHCDLSEQAQIVQSDSFDFLTNYHGVPFQIVYIAPPQYEDLWRKAIRMVDEKPQIVTEDGMIIAQIHPREDEPLEIHNFVEFDRRKYGSVLLIFYEKPLIEETAQ